MSLIADTEPSGYAPRLAAGIVFYARMLGGLRVEHIGIPFEHRGRTFAIHRSAIQGPLDASRYEVSDVESGFSLEGISGPTIEAAHAAALDAFARMTNAQWKRAFSRAAGAR
ncbi:hypothetical protein [Burkholderia gladioli]|uniref:Uncharacterized protein n=1 Tax=Burkholderia gladioli (strain BSR3) TaxID=999541 RepID=F2LS28_BURGS|nr:hypothetical protein [Burkholderia gladioli]AEA65687.1 hypothetical protein bgla_2p0940 [Burkholderia gladioli BSR3]